MATLASPTVVDLLSEQAGQAAAANPPSRVALVVIAFIFTAIGWLAGRTWFYAFKGVAFTALAVRYGYRQGMKVPVESAPPPAPSYP